MCNKKYISATINIKGEKMRFPKITKIFNNEVMKKNVQNSHDSINAKNTDYIPKLEELIESAQDYDSFYDIFENLEKQKIGTFVNSTIFKLNDIFIYLGFEKDANYYKDLFTKLSSSQLSLSPKFLKSVNSESGLSATFTQIPGTYNSELKDFYKFYDSLSLHNKEKAYSDIQQLLKMDLINNKILTRNAFAINPKTNDIVIYDWDSMSHISSQEDKLKFLNIARETLFRTT